MWNRSPAAWSTVFRIAIAMVLAMAPVSVSATAESDIDLDSHRELLEKGLTIHEIDRELERLAGQEREISRRIAETEKQMRTEKARLEHNRERAGKIIRSYYTGERITLLSVLLRLDNFSDMWTVLEYLNVIFQNDKKIIENYRTAIRKQEQLHEQWVQANREIGDIRELYLSRRERLVRLQRELEQELDQVPEAELVKRQIEELTSEWEEQGLPLFRQYFAALAKAMQDLPEILSDNDGHLTSNGMKWTFQMTEEDLNAFLRNKNEIFENITFSFEENRIVALGKDKERSVFISGQYTLRQEPEHHIAFRILELKYDGFSLPDTTRQALNEQFDLGFYPKKIVPFVVATDVLTEPGRLQVKLELDSGTSSDDSANDSSDE